MMKHRPKSPVVHQPPAQLANASDVELASLIRSKAADAERELYKRYFRSTLLFLRRYTRYSCQAEDFAQDALMVALCNLRNGRIEQPERLEGYIRLTARNLFVAEQRKLIHRSSLFAANVPEPASGSDDVFEDIARNESCARVWKLVAKLRQERDRQVLIQHYAMGISRSSISMTLGLTHDQFDRVISRARSRARDIIETHAPDLAG